MMGCSNHVGIRRGCSGESARIFIIHNIENSLLAESDAAAASETVPVALKYVKVVLPPAGKLSHINALTVDKQQMVRTSGA